MSGCLKGCVGRLLLVGVLLAAGAYAGFRWGPEMEPRVRAWLGQEPEEGDAVPTPELAEATLDRFETFREGTGPGRLQLGSLELSSVVRYALPGLLPPGVADPGVEVEDGRIYLSARVATAAFPELPSLDEVVGFLPDTVDIRMRGSLLPFDEEQAALHVDRIQAMKVPLPDRFVPKILEALGRRDVQGLPPDALMIPMPEGLRSAYVQADSLVLVADR